MSPRAPLNGLPTRYCWYPQSNFTSISFKRTSHQDIVRLESDGAEWWLKVQSPLESSVASSKALQVVPRLHLNAPREKELCHGLDHIASVGKETEIGVVFIARGILLLLVIEFSGTVASRLEIGFGKSHELRWCE